jgi:heme exporter protein D
MTRDERIEAVARLLCIQDGCEPDDSWVPGFQLWCAYSPDALEVILATLQSLREPDDAMIDASLAAGGYAPHQWVAMIDATIKEVAL